MRFDRWCEYLMLVLIGVSQLPSESDAKQLFLGKYPSPEETNGPINIDTDKVNTTFRSLLFLRGMLSDKLKLINTGTRVQVIDLVENTVSHASGGILGDDKYQFNRTDFLWTDDPNGVSANTINGKGFRMEAVGYFFNKKYGSFENCLHHRNGLAVFRFPVTICPLGLHSLRFALFAAKLKEVLEAGSSTITQLGTSVLWYNVIPLTATYYAYPGAYADEKTGKKYYCQTDIVFPLYPGACISKAQFAETFGSMKNSQEKRFDSIEMLFPRTQPVVKSFGVFQIVTYL